MTETLTITMEVRHVHPADYTWIERVHRWADSQYDVHRANLVKNILAEVLRCDVLMIDRTAERCLVSDDQVVEMLVELHHFGLIACEQVPRTGACFVTVLSPSQRGLPQ